MVKEYVYVSDDYKFIVLSRKISWFMFVDKHKAVYYKFLGEL